MERNPKPNCSYEAGQESKVGETVAGGMGVRHGEGLLLEAAKEAGSYLFPGVLPSGWVWYSGGGSQLKNGGQELMEKLTQNAALHTAMV